MTELREDLPKWQQIRDILAERIRSGRYKPGQRAPSERDVVQEFGVSAVTAHKALAGLRETGLTATQRGMGSFVRRPEDTPDPGGAPA